MLILGTKELASPEQTAPDVAFSRDIPLTMYVFPTGGVVVPTGMYVVPADGYGIDGFGLGFEALTGNSTSSTTGATTGSEFGIRVSTWTTRGWMYLVLLLLVGGTVSFVTSVLRSTTLRGEKSQLAVEESGLPESELGNLGLDKPVLDKRVLIWIASVLILIKPWWLPQHIPSEFGQRWLDNHYKNVDHHKFHSYAGFHLISDSEPQSPKDAPQSLKQAPLSPDYVPGPEYLKYLAPTNDEIPVEDQPLPVDASPTGLSPGYVVNSDPLEEDPKEDPANYLADYPVDKGDDEEEANESSEDDDDDEEEASKEDE
nr:hypothetical protein [Tanacetum cinerariifolium]